MPPFWRRMFGTPAAPVTMSAPRPAAQFAVDIPAELLQVMTGDGAIATRISRAQALQVPAVLRSRNLICGSIGTLPIRVHGPDRKVVTNVQYLVPQPDPEIASSVVMAQTVEDLLFEGISWWRVTKFGWHGFPIEARHIPVESVHVAPAGALMPSQARVSPDQPFAVDGQVYIDGIPVPDNEVIRFDSPNPPLLRHAARAIRTCLLLDTTAALYAKDPLPLAYFIPREGADPADDDEIQAVLDKWELARAQRATGYVNAALELKTAGWSPEQLQLAAARQHAVLEIARATGLDPEDLGVSTTSRTYQNLVERKQDRIDTTLGPYVSAVQDRLSMRDVLPRGYVARIDFAGFLRGDTKTRMETYKVGLEVGAYVEEEIRELEDKPALTPAQRAARKPAPQPSAEGVPTGDMPMRPNGARQERREGHVLPETAKFDAGEALRVQFETEDFQVDAQRRTIVGLLVPWGKIANNGQGKWRFTPGSIDDNVDVSRVKLNRFHDSHTLIGVATRLQRGSRGLTATFKLGRGPDADRALQDAEDGILDGLSAEVDFPDDGKSYEPDPTDRSVNLVHRANLRGAALTGTPAFDDARLTSVKASRDNSKGETMPEKSGNTGQPDAAFDFDGYMSGLAESIKQSQEHLVESHKKLTEELTSSLGDSFSAGIKTALENITTPQDGPEPVRAARYTVTREAPIYSLDGRGPCLVRDAWYAQREHDDDAKERLRRFAQQSNEVQKIVASHVAFQSQPGTQFATVTTGTAAAVIPPGYRPDLFVPKLAQQRPFVNACSRGTIGNATPFVVPVFGSSGGVGDHVEGTNPADGTLTFTTKTVTPGAISGKLPLSREIVDSSNPAIDQIALAAMNEDYARQTEAKVYTLLNGANGQGGTITAGFVPSGAQVAFTGATPTGQAVVAKVREQLALYPFRRFAAPNRALLSQRSTTSFATAVDTTNRPLLPSVGATNSAGVGNAVEVGWFVDGLAHVPAWAITGVANTDGDIFMLNSADVWAWESPVLSFRFEEKQGPAIIELALFGYFATHLLRPVGLSAIRQSAGV